MKPKYFEFLNFILNFCLRNILLSVWNYDITFVNVIDLSSQVLERIQNFVLLLQTFIIKLFNLEFYIIINNLEPELSKFN